MQYNGTDLGYQLGYGEITTSPVLTMPALESCFRAVDFILGTIFTVEIVLKLAAFKKDISLSLQTPHKDRKSVVRCL